MIHNLIENPNDLPPLKKGLTVCKTPYHISVKVVNQNGYRCHYNYKYKVWCFDEGYSKEMIWWKEED